LSERNVGEIGLCDIQTDRQTDRQMSLNASITAGDKYSTICVWADDYFDLT